MFRSSSLICLPLAWLLLSGCRWPGVDQHEHPYRVPSDEKREVISDQVSVVGKPVAKGLEAPVSTLLNSQPSTINVGVDELLQILSDAAHDNIPANTEQVQECEQEEQE